MATINKMGAYRAPAFAAAYGNAINLQYTLQTTATGALVNSDTAAAIAANDVVRLGIIQAGMTLMDALSSVSTVLVGAAKVGFLYVDGVDSTAVPQRDDYFHAALALAAQGKTRANNLAVAPVTLPKDAYLVVTPAAAQTAAGRLDIFVQGIWQGYPNV